MPYKAFLTMGPLAKIIMCVSAFSGGVWGKKCSQKLSGCGSCLMKWTLMESTDDPQVFEKVILAKK